MADRAPARPSRVTCKNEVQHGVTQGSILGPLFLMLNIFSLYYYLSAVIQHSVFNRQMEMLKKESNRFKLQI
jgi:hypothetical protein